MTFVPLTKMSESARHSFIYFHPKMITTPRTWEDDIYEEAKKQYEDILIFEIIQGHFDAVKSKEPGKTTIFINENLSILNVAEKYGLKVKKNKIICPFHNDSDPSLVFFPHTNSFFCYGCRVGGDVITFIQKLEELKDG